MSTIIRRLSHKLFRELLPFVKLYSGNIVSRNVLILGIPSPFVIVLTLWSLLLGPGAVPTDTTLSNRVVVQNVQGRQNRGQGNNARGAGAIGHIARNAALTQAGPQNSEYFKDKMLLMQAQENGVVLDEEQLLFLAGGLDNAIDEDVDEQPVQDLALNVDNVFQADDCDAYDSDVDDAPTAQTLFMANLSSADPVYDEAGPSYDSDVLSEVQNHDHYQDAVCDHHDEHEMHDDVQPNHVVDSHADYTL
ncbi:hypothetical protein Tco_0199027 [Tanacetum coccineum]